MRRSSISHRNSHRHGGALFSVLAILAVLLIIIVLNAFFSNVRLRADLTEDDIFSLQEGTKQILQDLDTPVTITLYATRDPELMTPELLLFADRVRDLLEEYEETAPKREISVKGEDGKFKKEKRSVIEIRDLDPEPFSQAEDSAKLDGIQPLNQQEVAQFGAEPYYLGISVTCLDSKETIPSLSPDAYRFLEYGITESISKAYQGEDLPKIGIISSLPIFGEENIGLPPLIVVSALEQSFEIQQVDLLNDDISPEDQSTLLVIHPGSLTPQALSKLDQYLLQGGNLIVFVDPHCQYASVLEKVQSQILMSQQRNMQQMPPPFGVIPIRSNLDALLEPWGIKFDTEKAVIDEERSAMVNYVYSSRIFGQIPGVPREMPNLLLRGENFNEKVTFMANMDSLNFGVPGALDVDARDDVEVETLIVAPAESSTLVETHKAAGELELALQTTKPDAKEHVIGVWLSGKFSSAIDLPDQDEEADSPALQETGGEGEEGDEQNGENAEAAPKLLDRSAADGNLVVFSDVDMVWEGVFVTQERTRSTIRQVLGENFQLVLNLVDFFSGNQNLIQLRSRAFTDRPLRKIEEIEKQAQERVEATAEAAEEKRRAAESKIQLFQEGDQLIFSIPSEEMEEAQQSLREAEAEIRRVRREERKEVADKKNFYKAFTIFTMPVVIAGIGVGLAAYRRFSR